MKYLIFILLIPLMFMECTKSEEKKTGQTSLPVTEAVKTGDWMVTYFINNVVTDMGLTFLKFNKTGSLTATKDGTPYTGTWTETNTGGNNMLAINITTSDVKLQRANATWKVMNISEYFIDLKDPTAAGNVTVQLMKH